MAVATVEAMVVLAGGSAARTATLSRPDRSSSIAVVRPITPAPIMAIAGLLLIVTLALPCASCTATCSARLGVRYERVLAPRISTVPESFKIELCAPDVVGLLRQKDSGHQAVS